MNKYGKSRSMENFKETKGSNFAIYTPYLKVADVSQTITEKYIEPNIDNIMEELKKRKSKFKKIYIVQHGLVEIA